MKLGRVPKRYLNSQVRLIRIRRCFTMNQFDGKVALITGSSSGIGAATAIHFASLGCSLALSGRNVERLNEKAKKCLEAGLHPDKVLVVAGDISNEEEAKTVVDKTVEHFGQLDILVNNAGIAEIGNSQSSTLSQLDRTFRTNFRAVFQLTQLAIPYLKQTKGNIVNVSSVAAHTASHEQMVYGASKAALDHLTKSMARDLGPSGVRVNAVNPGYVETAIFWGMGLPDEKVKALLEGAKKLHVLERIGYAAEIAKPISFLASDDASFITGVTLLVDGGLKLRGSTT